VHTEIEEEIFYPAFLEATEDKDTHHEAEVEHGGAKKLIAEIESSGPKDDYYDAKVKVLSEMIKHHVKEEEQRGGDVRGSARLGYGSEGAGRTACGPQVAADGIQLSFAVPSVGRRALRAS